MQHQADGTKAVSTTIDEEQDNWMRIDFSPPDITEAEISAVADALRSGWITTGPRTKQLEAELATWCQTPRVVCLNSATAALECALRLLGIGPGDEVITSAYTYTASASVICHVGARPVLVDTAPGSYQMDYDALANAVTTRTKAVIPVDVAGVMCDYQRLFELLGRERVAGLYTPAPKTLQTAFDRVIVLADAAHSFGASYQGQSSGSVADFTAFSFHAVKNLTTAEGGALTWRSRKGLADDALYHQMMLLSLHGQDKDALSKTKAGAWEYDIIAPLYKCNMTDVVAALGLAQLQRYPQLLERRRQIAERYASKLALLGKELVGKSVDANAAAGSAGGGVDVYAAVGSAGGVAGTVGGGGVVPTTAPAPAPTTVTSAPAPSRTPGIIDVLSHQSDSGLSSAHLCLVRLLGKDEAFRNNFIAQMAERGVSCNVHYKPLPKLTAYKDMGFDIKDYPNAFAQYQNEVTLPLHSRLSDEEVDYVIEAFRQSYLEAS
jgi:dTDP-4-amino-4,6-dideoxygalactose transaminase